MKRGDLISANFLSVRYTKETKIGIVLDYQEKHSDFCGKVKMLCGSGEIREFVVGFPPYDVEIINETR